MRAARLSQGSPSPQSLSRKREREPGSGPLSPWERVRVRVRSPLARLALTPALSRKRRGGNGGIGLFRGVRVDFAALRSGSFEHIRADRLAAEVGTIHKQATRAIALCYPSPYAVGMSSLGFQTVYRLLNGMDDVCAERAFLPDDVAPGARRARAAAHLRVGAAGRRLPDRRVLARLRAGAGRPGRLPRHGRHPARSPRSAPRDRGTCRSIVIGGPLTFSNPVPAGALRRRDADGRSRGDAARAARRAARRARPRRAARRPGRAARLLRARRCTARACPPIAAARRREPARYSQIRTPNTELRDMFLIEPERGCHRGCTYCVMRRSTNGGMRLVAPDEVLSLIPDDARRVGLVGAAVTDHPRPARDLARASSTRGREVGISSLRADRLNDEIVGLLKRGGYTHADHRRRRRVRARCATRIERKTKERHLLRAAELARAHEHEAAQALHDAGPARRDRRTTSTSSGASAWSCRTIAPRLVLGIAPFVAKRNTPLDGSPFEAIDVRRRASSRACARPSRGRVDAAPDVAEVGVGRVPPGAGRYGGRARRGARRPRGRTVRRLEGGVRRGPRARRQPGAREPSADDRDRVDLDEGALGQARGLNGRARRQRRREIRA